MLRSLRVGTVGCIWLLALLSGMPARTTQAAANEYVVADPAAPTGAQPIVVLQPRDGAWFEWERARKFRNYVGTDEGLMRDAVVFLREGVQRMTGVDLPVVVAADPQPGIVLALRRDLPAAVANDPEVVSALRNDGSNAYNDREAFFIRTTPTQTWLIANTIDGLPTAAAELLETVDYVVLGMGPNWTHVPDYRQRALTFNVQRAGRPSFFIRALSATTGQSYGVGTLSEGRKMTFAEGDEPVEVSYKRWRVASRTLTNSMPHFPGHALQAYHKAAVAYMLEHQTTEGFLAQAQLGADAARPTPPPAGLELWINTDAAPDPAAGKVYVVRNNEWKEGNLASLPMSLDLTLPWVRQLILARLQDASEKHFEKNPDDNFIFGTDPEDGGGYNDFAQLARQKQWYPQYRQEIGKPLNAPYVLHGQFGLDQPTERWDGDAVPDQVYALNNWLLSEYDRWLDSRPEAERVTRTGRDKKQLLRLSLYCYNYHDVPPHFNLDQRIRLMIAGYPKHRGRGPWKDIRTQHQAAQAFSIMLPREPSGEYRIISLSYFWDGTAAGIVPGFDAHPQAIAQDLRETYDAGIRALNYEVDFNFGKMGLGYYLLSRALWDVNLGETGLTQLRERWLRLAYGRGWEAMRQYYDLMLPRNYPVNGPHTWAKAIDCIQQADALIDPATEPAAQRRLDDLKQFWLFYYLTETDQAKPGNPAFKTFAWKGQMSYMTAMHMVMRKFFNTNDPAQAAGAEIAAGPAHYTAEETAAWWQTIVAAWPLQPVNEWAQQTLADGTPALKVDQLDLVQVRQFAAPGPQQPFVYNSALEPPVHFYTFAAQPGARIGFTIFWPALDDPRQQYYHAKTVSYGADRWDAQRRQWEPFLDPNMSALASHQAEAPWRKGNVHVVRVEVEAPAAGTYRFEVGRAGLSAMLAPLDLDPATGRAASSTGLCFNEPIAGHTQTAAYFYIPKGLKQLDLEVYDAHNRKTLTLYQGFPPSRPTASRTVDVSARATHRVELQPGEDGTIAHFTGNGFAFPFLYSVPNIWAKSPQELLVPRAIAQADGLEVVE